MHPSAKDKRKFINFYEHQCDLFSFGRCYENISEKTEILYQEILWPSVPGGGPPIDMSDIVPPLIVLVVPELHALALATHKMASKHARPNHPPRSHTMPLKHGAGKGERNKSGRGVYHFSP